MFEYFLITFASLVNILLGIVILDRRSEISWYQRFFSFSSIFVGLWGISTIMLNLYTNMFWERILFFCAVSALYYILVFSYEYIEKKNDYFLYFASISYLAISLMILFTDLIVSDVDKNLTGGIQVTLGRLMPVFTIYMLVLIIALINNLVRGYKNSSPLKKLQLRYIIIGTICFVVPALITNLFLPTIGIYTYNNFGVIFSIFFTSFVTFAIIKHRLFSVRTISLKIIQVLIIATILLFIVLIQRYVKDKVLGLEPYQLEAIILDFMTAVVVAAGLQAFSNRLEARVAKALNSEVSMLSKILEDIDSKTGAELDAGTIMDTTIQILEEGFPDTRINYYVHGEDMEEKLYPESHVDIRTLYFVKKIKHIYIFQEDTEYSETWKRAKTNNIGFVLTLSDSYSLIGFKQSKDDVYSKSELDTLESMALKLRDIFARVEVYEQTRRFNKELSRRVAEATRELQKKVGELEDARRKERDMMDIMGHELRTPLTIIKMKQSLLRKKATDRPKEFTVDDFLASDTSIKQALEREIELLETMLSSTKIDAGRMDLQIDKTDLSNAIESTIDAYKHQADNKNLKLEVYEEREGIEVYADEVRLIEVIDNFVSNAIKYTDKGGISVHTRTRGEMVEITVKDTGKGIPKKAIKKLGEKFFRVGHYIDEGKHVTDPENIVRPGGTGLGLYVAFRLIEMMDGEYRIESEEGKGSKFIFTVPLYVGQKPRTSSKLKRNVFKRVGLDE